MGKLNFSELFRTNYGIIIFNIVLVCLALAEDATVSFSIIFLFFLFGLVHS
jgi:hypothetical protein